MAKTMYCTRCGHTGKTTRVMPGSILVEIVLWLFLLVPGILYSLWRHSASFQGCAKCKGDDVIPVDSPRARERFGSAAYLLDV